MREEFHLKTGELTRLRGDQVVRDWLVLIEQCERIWKDELAARRSKKFAVLLGSQGQWRRRALSREAIDDLHKYISDCKRVNEITSREKDSGLRIGENSLEKDMDEEEKNQEELVMHEKQLDVDNEQAVNVGGETGKQTKFVSDNVVNLSNRVLSEAEISLLSKGLKFCPTPLELDRSAIKRILRNLVVKSNARHISCLVLLMRRLDLVSIIRCMS